MVSWRRVASRELSLLHLTFTQWLLLQTMDELIGETRDAVSQFAVANRSGVDETTVSQVMKKLARRALVDVGPDMQWPGLRIWLTRHGEKAARAGAARVEAVSMTWLAERNGLRLGLDTDDPQRAQGKISRSR